MLFIGILDKIKDLFGSVSIESIQDYEKELQKLHSNAMFSEGVGIIGTGGRLKGLPLIYSVNNEEDFKKGVARISELIHHARELNFQKQLVEVNLNFDGLYLILIPIKEDFGFLGISPTWNDMKVFREWMKKNLKKIEELFKE